jgi:hypothetical protein
MSAQHTPGPKSSSPGFTEALRQHLAARESAPYSTSLREPLRLAREMRDAMAAVDRTYDIEYMEDGRAAIAKATGSAA